jgi:hypothetical protein
MKRRKPSINSTLPETFDNELLTAEDARHRTLIELVTERKLRYMNDKAHPARRAVQSAPSMFKSRSH